MHLKAKRRSQWRRAPKAVSGSVLSALFLASALLLPSGPAMSQGTSIDCINCFFRGSGNSDFSVNPVFEWTTGPPAPVNFTIYSDQSGSVRFSVPVDLQVMEPDSNGAIPCGGAQFSLMVTLSYSGYVADPQNPGVYYLQSATIVVTSDMPATITINENPGCQAETVSTSLIAFLGSGTFDAFVEFGSNPGYLPCGLNNAICGEAMSYGFSNTTPNAFSVLDFQGSTGSMNTCAETWYLTETVGTVTVNGLPAAAGTPLYPGDTVSTGDASRALLSNPDGHNSLDMQADSTLVVSAPTNQAQSSVSLLIGALHDLVSHIASCGQVEVDSPEAVAAVRATEFVVSVYPGNSTNVISIQDPVSVVDIASGANVTLSSGQQVTVNDTGGAMSQATLQASITTFTPTPSNEWWLTAPSNSTATTSSVSSSLSSAMATSSVSTSSSGASQGSSTTVSTATASTTVPKPSPIPEFPFQILAGVILVSVIGISYFTTRRRSPRK